MFFPLREFNVYGMLVDPAAALLVLSGALFFLARLALNRYVDLNRFVWRRPLFQVAILVILYCLSILTLRPL